MSADASPPVSLEQFAPQPTTCGTCKLPEDVRYELEVHRKSDPSRFTYRVISDWLSTKGHIIHPDALRRHFNRGHLLPSGGLRE